MNKIIRLKKNVFDYSHPAIPEEQAINDTSKRLTETLLHESHPLYQKLLQSYREEDIRSRRLRFDVCGKALYTKHPMPGKADSALQCHLPVPADGDDGCQEETDCGD